MLLNTIVNARFDDAAMAEFTKIIKHLEYRCNAEKKKLVTPVQHMQATPGNYPEEANSHHAATTAIPRMMERINYSLGDNETRVNLMEVGESLTLDQVISTPLKC